MKMVRAVIRPEKEENVLKALDQAGFPAVTKMDVRGRGRQKGLKIGNVVYDEIVKIMILLVVEDSMADKAVSVISQSARTGNFGDGKIFVTSMTSSMTIRTGRVDQELALRA